MSESLAGLKRKIDLASDLRSVVRTMKTVAAANISQYEKSAKALEDYYHSVELGLGVCLRHSRLNQSKPTINSIKAVVFGSDQGLVGQFNQIIADHAVKSAVVQKNQVDFLAVGERVAARLENAGISAQSIARVPSSVDGIKAVVETILLEGEASELYLFYNHRTSGSTYEPATQRLLPLDLRWAEQLKQKLWPSKNLPEVLGKGESTLQAFIREYLFVAIFRACAESLASENASRLAAMQRADKNIDGLLADLNGSYHRQRQDGIDEELFDVVAGSEALARAKGRDGSREKRER